MASLSLSLSLWAGGTVYLLNIMIQKPLLRGRGSSIIMKLNELNKEVKIKKKLKKNLRGLELGTFFFFGYIFSYNFMVMIWY